MKAGGGGGGMMTRAHLVSAIGRSSGSVWLRAGFCALYVATVV